MGDILVKEKQVHPLCMESLRGKSNIITIFFCGDPFAKSGLNYFLFCVYDLYYGVLEPD